MRIAQPPNGGDFYESFSDLIFGTLIIFLVVVLALILQVHETVKGLDERIGGVITPHRFTGATGQTTFTFALLPGQVMDIEESVVVMFPYKVAADWNLPREPGVVDPVQDVCRAYLNDELLMMPVSDFVGMAGSLTPSATLPDLSTCPALHHTSLGEVVIRLYALENSDYVELRGLTPEQARDAIGGIDLYSPYEPWDEENIRAWFDLPGYQFHNVANFYRDFLENLERAEREMILPFNTASVAEGVDRPDGIRIAEAPEKRLRVGTTEFSVVDFLRLMESIAPGRGFVVEYVDGNAEGPVYPPLWIMDEVLKPAGFDAWVVEDDEPASG